MSETVAVPKELWAEVCEVLELKRIHAFADPQHHERVKQLGMEIGFGALMSTASAGWREVAEVKGSEFVAGPCQGTIDGLLARIDAFNEKSQELVMGYQILPKPIGFEWGYGERLRKFKGASWQGRVVGFYSNELTPEGYAVESEREPGSVQIYPRAALERV